MESQNRGCKGHVEPFGRREIDMLDMDDMAGGRGIDNGSGAWKEGSKQVQLWRNNRIGVP